MFNKPLLLISLLLFTVSAFCSDTARPKRYGYMLPYPVQKGEMPQEIKEKSYSYKYTYDFKIEIDKKGKVKKVYTDTTVNEKVGKLLVDYLKSFRFEPAVLSEKKIESTLPVKVELIPYNFGVNLIFPLDSNAAVTSYKLYDDAYRLNGIIPPAVLLFPPIYCTLTPSDTTGLYPYFLAKVSLDEEGRLLGREVVKSTYPEFTSQLFSALMYASYRPAEVKGKQIPSEAYFIFSFYPALNYPTKRWGMGWSKSQLSESQVRLLPDLSSGISDPVLKMDASSILSLNFVGVNFMDSISASIKIDTTGRVYSYNFSGISKQEIPNFREFIKKMSFYPALDSSGNPVMRKGTVKLYKQIEPIIPNSKIDPRLPVDINVRISYFWY